MLSSTTRTNKGGISVLNESLYKRRAVCQMAWGGGGTEEVNPPPLKAIPALIFPRCVPFSLRNVNLVDSILRGSSLKLLITYLFLLNLLLTHTYYV